MSAPSVSGRCRIGVANVLSTSSCAPASCAIPPRAWMSKIFIRGFDGVSIQMSFVDGRNALFNTAKFCRSSTLLSIPQEGRKS